MLLEHFWLFLILSISGGLQVRKSWCLAGFFSKFQAIKAKMNQMIARKVAKSANFADYSPSCSLISMGILL
jgi:hypothetical protein